MRSKTTNEQFLRCYILKLKNENDLVHRTPVAFDMVFVQFDAQYHNSSVMISVWIQSLNFCC